MLPRKEICHTQLLINNNENKYMYIENNENNTLNFKTTQSEGVMCYNSKRKK